MQKHINIIDLVKSFPTNIYLQNLASMQKRTSPIKFAHLAEKSGKGSISNLSTKVIAPAPVGPVDENARESSTHIMSPGVPRENLLGVPQAALALGQN